MSKYLVGIDEGTTGCKTCVFDIRGNQLSKSYQEYACYYPKPGYVEQDIDEITSAVFATCCEAISSSGIDPKEIAAVSFSNQGGIVVLLDENEALVRRMGIGWQDLRYLDVVSDLRSAISERDNYSLSGMPLGLYFTGIYRWLEKYEPVIWQKVRRICTHQDYFLKQLGADTYVTDISNAAEQGLVNVETREWDPELLDAYGVSHICLPTIVDSKGQVVGHVSAEAAEISGLPVGCPICLGGLDINSCIFASGAVHPGDAVMIAGTVGCSCVMLPEMIPDPKGDVVLKCHHGVPNYHLQTISYTAASTMKWFKDTLCEKETEIADRTEQDSYDLITESASLSVPGSNGVIVIPSFQGSQGRIINFEARGSILGLSLSTTKSDIAHAVLEGICCELVDNLRIQEAITGIALRVKLSGGVTKSPYWCQMFADILQKPVDVMQIEETGCLGAAMYAGLGIGVFKDYNDAVEKCVHVSRTYHPNRDNCAIYQVMFERWRDAKININRFLYSSQKDVNVE